MKYIKWGVVAGAVLIGIIWINGKSEIKQIEYTGIAIWVIAMSAYSGLHSEVSELKKRIKLLELKSGQNY